MATILMTALIFCILITIIEVLGTRINPVYGLHNLPKDIQERVYSLPQSWDKAGKILSTRERIIKKLPALMIILVVFAGVVYTAGARNFTQGFVYTFMMWGIVKMYVTLVLVCGWYAHSPSAWIPGTKDMEESYQNYRFYLGSIPRSLLTGAIVGAVIGGMIQIAL